MSKIELYLIRHAESEANTKPHIVSGRSNNTPLTELGVNQAITAGRHLLQKGIIPSRVYSSPAVRTIQTAEHVLNEMGVAIKPIKVEALQELHQGDNVGRIRSDVYTDEVIDEIKRLGKDFKVPNGESMNEVGSRMFEWINSLSTVGEKNTEVQKVFVFTHGVAIKCLASTLCNWSHEKTYKTITDNTSVSLFTLNDGKWKLDFIGKMSKDI
jgi:alpha-ribazole phosphatase